MSGRWQPDPTGLHGERFHDGTRWTTQVRTGETTAFDARGLDGLPGGLTTAGAPPAPASAPPSAPPSAGAPGFASPNPAAAPTEVTVRRGLPPLLALSVALSAFPPLMMLAGGLVGLMVSGELSDPGSSLRRDRYLRRTSEQWADATSSVGVVVLVVGLVLLGFVIAAGAGRNLGRVVTVVWLALGTLISLATMATVPDVGGAGLIGVVPAGVAIVGFFTPAANEVYRRR